MKVKDIINTLQRFDPELEVTITHEGICYKTDESEIVLFDNDEGFKIVDIGIGGLRFE